MNFYKENISVSTDKSKLNIDVIYGFLSNSYWASTRSIEDVKESIDNSICFGLYLDGIQIGFARVLTDKIAFAYLMDVFVLEEYRGLGYSKLLLHTIFEYSEFTNIGKWFLATRDAHGLYKQFGFNEVAKPETLMEKFKIK